MALQLQSHTNLHAYKNVISYRKIYRNQSFNGRKDGFQEATITKAGRSPAEEFAPLTSKFRRRLLTGVGSATLVALGANFTGITSFLLGFAPETSQNLKLDVLYPIKGYSRYIDSEEGFEFLNPASWVGDQRLLYRAAEKTERSLDPPPLGDGNSGADKRRKNANEPIIAFGPPGSTGELNVSVIVSPIDLDFRIEAFGGPKEVGEALVRKVTGSGKRLDLKGTLMESTLRIDPLKNVKYYQLEFKVESPSFQRHNIAVFCTRGGKLYTLNAQAPESEWPAIESSFRTIADSFSLTS